MSGIPNPGRRSVLTLLSAATACGFMPAFSARVLAAQTLGLDGGTGGGEALDLAEPFSHDGLVARAREMASQPHSPSPDNPVLNDALKSIDYDAYQKIVFRPERALWRDRSGAPSIAPFHMHEFAREPVALHLVDGDSARRVPYDPTVFRYTGIAPPEVAGMGWAGFRVLDAKNPASDWLAFMGATYFRSAGPLGQYGQSARAVAVDTAMAGRAERFPRFTDIWLEPLGKGGLTIWALIDGESLTGVYRAQCKAPGADSVDMDISVRFFTRTPIGRLGIAPMTSMFWFSETNRHEATDWRPEIHDTDGLALLTGAGERLWRPLDNPKATRVSTFTDTNPKGFGLLQRDRDFTHYEDDGVFYNRRAGIWIEPKGDWGQGGVQLVEIPTDDEIHDNIVAYWTTDMPIEAGKALSYDYTLRWVAAPVLGPMGVGRVVTSRQGRPGVPGQPRPSQGGTKYVIDFEGGDLASYTTADGRVTADVTAGNARIDNPYALRVVGTDRWRLVVDIYPHGMGAVDIRAFLRDGNKSLTETWIYRYRDPQFI
ncbi:MAG: glucan biosynthesis protein [Rhodospirillum sp.]|nr:glucan biosynthesis protein [Rhodospirillum sp.]